MNEEQSCEKLNNANPFVGAKPYGQNDVALFAGRDREISDIGFQLLAQPVFLVYGESGVGKTSLVRAGLKQWVSDRNAIFNYLDCRKHLKAVMTNVLDEIIHKFKEIQEKDSSENTQYQFIFEEVFNEAVSNKDKRHKVICIDSFEQVFNYAVSENIIREKFTLLAKRILATPDTSFVLMMRSEWLAHLELYERLLPNSLKARYRIDPLSKKSTQEVIKKVAESTHPFDDSGAQWVIRQIINVGTESVDLTIMQILCQWIWEEAKKSGRKKEQLIDETWLEELNDHLVDAKLKDVYEEKLGILPSPKEEVEKKFRHWLEAAITTDKNCEIAPKVILRDLSASFRGTIDALEESHILKRVELRTKNPTDLILYEIAHDLWVKAIYDSNQTYKENSEVLIFDGQPIKLKEKIKENALKNRVKNIMINICVKEKEEQEKKEKGAADYDKHHESKHLDKRSECSEEMDKCKPEILNQYRRQALAYIGLNALEGKPDFNWFSDETYKQFEKVRVRDAEYLRAYLQWERNGGEYDDSPDQEISKRYFNSTTSLLKQRMVNRDIKIPHIDTNKSYVALKEYLNKIAGDIENEWGWEKANESRLNIVDWKARWLEEDRRFYGRPASDEKNWCDAVRYTKLFYNAVYQLLIKNDENDAADNNSEKEKAIKTLEKAVSSDDKHSLINCFEAAILMYYVSPEHVADAVLTSIFD